MNYTKEEVLIYAKHYIESLLVVPSHYCRQDTEKVYLPHDLTILVICIDFILRVNRPKFINFNYKKIRIDQKGKRDRKRNNKEKTVQEDFADDGRIKLKPCINNDCHYL